MKAIITDLDNTLWGGIVGEVGSSNVSCAGIYRSYQELLKKLSKEGILLAIASKNDPNNEDLYKVFEREDMNISLDSFFPVSISWSEKSKSILKILKVWNILPKDVLFVDDSSFEIGQVKSVFPEMPCVLFDVGVQVIVNYIESFFPKKKSITTEDTLRMDSIKSGILFEREKNMFDEEKFYFQLESKINFSVELPGKYSERVLELLNKTNQFNLNGKRITKEDFEKCLEDPDKLCMSVSYEDKFGQLGTVGVVMIENYNNYNDFLVRYMCLSCRSLNRRIEFALIKELFTADRQMSIYFDFVRTEHNGIFGDFLREISENNRVTFSTFIVECPRLYHKINFV